MKWPFRRKGHLGDFQRNCWTQQLLLFCISIIECEFSIFLPLFLFTCFIGSGTGTFWASLRASCNLFMTASILFKFSRKISFVFWNIISSNKWKFLLFANFHFFPSAFQSPFFELLYFVPIPFYLREISAFPPHTVQIFTSNRILYLRMLIPQYFLAYRTYFEIIRFHQFFCCYSLTLFPLNHFLQ